jgi:hypothetical protein
VTAEMRILALADRLSRASGIGAHPLDADALIDRAFGQRPSGKDDPDTTLLRHPLRQLCAALESEAKLSLAGRIAARWDAIRCLENWLRLRDEARRTPGIGEIAIRRPLIITGLPRSGTTFLHRLLDCDPSNLSPSCWQVMAPYPPLRGSDRRIQKTTAQLRCFARLAPGFQAVHPLSATAPQECSEIAAQTFQSLRYDTLFRVPSYLAWLDKEGHEAAYRFHKQFLQHLQHQLGPLPDDRRWVLKCPDHVFALESARRVYPDARIVLVHRDPIKVLASVASLTEILRRPFTRRIDRAEIGLQVATRWEQGAAAMMAAAPAGRVATDGIFHLQYSEISKDPLAAIRGLYGHFDMALSSDVLAKMQSEVSRRPRGGYGRNLYDLRDHGLSVDRERDRFASYTEQFGLPIEA